MMQSRVSLLAVIGVVMAVAPAGAGTMYATNDSNDFFYWVDVTTGIGTSIGPTGVDLSFTGLAFDTSTGTMYVSDAFDHPVNGLGIVDLATGAVTMVGNHMNSVNIHGLAYDSVHDELYGADTMPCGGLAVVNRATGESTCIGPFVVTPAIYGLAFDAVTDTLYGIDGDNLYTIDRNSGAATVVGSHGMLGSSGTMGLDFDPETETLYGARSDQFFIIDPATGAGTLVGATGILNSGGLASVPVRPIFADGFESGDTSAWSAVVP